MGRKVLFLCMVIFIFSIVNFHVYGNWQEMSAPHLNLYGEA